MTSQLNSSTSASMENIYNIDKKLETESTVKDDYHDFLYNALRRNKSRNPANNEPEDFWTQRHKRMKKQLEIEQEMFDNLYQLQKLSDHKSEIKSAQMNAEGLVDTSNPMPVIVGVPAKYLLSMLTADSN